MHVALHAYKHLVLPPWQFHRTVIIRVYPASPEVLMKHTVLGPPRAPGSVDLE